LSVIYCLPSRSVVSGNDISTGRILSAHLAGNQPLIWPENPAQTVYKQSITDTKTLHQFIADHVEPGSTVITDGWSGYLGIQAAGYDHDRRSQRAATARGEDPAQLLPGVHRIAALAKRWLLGTHQGAVDREHLPSYLNEFVFRFNRRTSRNRGLVFMRVLQFAVGHDPVRYRELIKHPRPRETPPVPPGATGHPPSLERPRQHRPWRRPDLHNSG